MGLQNAYPPGSFLTIVEDLGGSKISEEQLEKLYEELEEISRECHREVAKATEKLYAQIRQKDLQLKLKGEEIAALKEKNLRDHKLLSEDLRMQFECKLNNQKKIMQGKFDTEIKEY